MRKDLFRVSGIKVKEAMRTDRHRFDQDGPLFFLVRDLLARDRGFELDAVRVVALEVGSIDFSLQDVTFGTQLNNDMIGVAWCA